MAVISIEEYIQGPVTPGGTTVSLSGSDIGAGAVGTSNLASGAVTGAKVASATLTGSNVASATLKKANILMFAAVGQTGTGSAQNIAHGLGVVPSVVFITFDGASVPTAVAQGTHTTSNVVVTVSESGTFGVVAIA